MTLRKKLWLSLMGIMAISLVGTLIVIPKGPDIKIGKIEKSLFIHLGLDLRGGASLMYEADVSKVSGNDQEEAMLGVRDVIERRINAFGVSEPVVQTNKIQSHWRVLVELPGVTDIDEAVQRIGETPLLEFRESVEWSEEQKKAVQSINDEKKKEAEKILNEVKKEGADFADIANKNTEDPSNQNPETGEQKGGDLGFFASGTMVQEFEDAARQTTKGEIYPDVVETIYGYHIIKVTDLRTTDGKEEIRASNILFRKITLDNESNFQNTQLTGAHLKGSSVTFDSTTNLPQVSLTFNDEGSKLFEEITGRNIGKPIAIYLDSEPISIPVVNQKISGGQAVITGDFDLEEAKQLNRRLNSGALPVPITLVSQETIGPSLGKEAIERSFLAGMIGILFVIIFMISYYRFPGFLAVVSLSLYSILVIAIFKLWPITLTLAGIAGFILSIGMAVDANILIFERMKEELRGNKPLPTSIEDGFSRAWLSIRDSNISSLITCFILVWFGSSIVKGFAITLGIGIAVSMFSAITITRTFLRMVAMTRLARYAFLWGKHD